jgi:hypothetical protein
VKFDPKKEPMWLSDEIGIRLFNWCLCIDEKAYVKALAQLAKEGKHLTPNWPDDGARCQFVMCNGEASDCVVMLVEKEDPIENAVLLVHEAVHIWQMFCQTIGERNPSDEFMAYTIQNITHRLYHAYQMALEHREKK